VSAPRGRKKRPFFGDLSSTAGEPTLDDAVRRTAAVRVSYRCAMSNVPGRSRTAPSDKSGVRTLARVALAWLPLAALWALITLSAEGTDLASAVRFGLVSISAAALLGFGVWKLTGRYPWPDRVNLGFYAAHATAGAAYATAWMVLGMAVNALIVGLPLFGWHLDTFLTVWRFLMGLLLYGLIAGVSYSMRIREQLRRQERATLAAQTLAAEAKLDSLRAQLNPHFLFNALHSVSELMHTDVRAAERSLEDLAGLLRYSLDADAGDLVTLAEEWRFVGGYLAMEELRLGDRLRVHSNLSPEALAARLPSFTLQVLVENSVRHAVADRPEGGSIRIAARLQNELLHLEVADDGAGFNGSRARSAPDNGRRGRGLTLLRDRLLAAYGGAAELDVDSRPGVGARVTVTVPAYAHGIVRQEERRLPQLDRSAPLPRDDAP
jgi:signal transduction histidine kinase